MRAVSSMSYIRAGSVRAAYHSLSIKTAKQIGVTVPQSVLFRADTVIK